MHLPRLALLLAASLALLGCEPSPPAGPRGLPPRAATQRFLGFPPDLGQGAYRPVDAFPNLRFDWAVRALHQPRGNRFFVIEREGKLWSFRNDPAATDKTLVLDLSAHTQGYYDCGLLGLVFHPRYGQAGAQGADEVFLWYNFTERPQGSREDRPRYRTPSFNRLSRFRLPDPAGTIDPASEVVLIDQYNETTFHEGGAMFFHPDDGFLYLTVGDDFVDDNAQKLDRSLFSGILRLDVDQDPRRSHPIRRQPRNGQTAHYFIPDDNPFVDPSGNSLEEFWALGLRSPHVMSLDRPTGRIFIGDVGHQLREEVSFIEKGVVGANFEWPIREGREGGPLPPGLHGHPAPPLLDYAHADGDNCVIGGFVYRGRHFPELQGRYLFGDNGSNRVWALDPNAGPQAERRQIARLPGLQGYAGGLSSVAEDPDGEPILVRVGARMPLYRLEPAPRDKVPVPALLSQTGLFADTPRLQPAPGVVPYDVNLPHWTDGAVARHFLAVPRDGDAQLDPEKEQVAYAAGGAWGLPKGSVLVQHLDLPTDARDPGPRRPLETRVLVRGRGDFYALSYRWRDDGSDAELVPPNGLGTVDVPVTDDHGRPSTQPWAFLSRSQCRQCHNPVAGTVLGLTAAQLDRERDYPQARDNQVRALAHAGYLSQAPGERALRRLAKLVAIDDEAVELEQRVRDYLDVNCSACHRPQGSRAQFDARRETPLRKAGLVWAEPLDPLGLRGAYLVKPRDTGNSVLMMRLLSVGMLGQAMPPVGKLKADAQAIEAFKRWIARLPEYD